MHAHACFWTYEPFLGPSPNQPSSQTNKLVLELHICADDSLPGAAFASWRHGLFPGKQLLQLIVGAMVWISLLDANCCGPARKKKINVKLRSIQLNIQQNKQTFVLSLIELAHGTDPNILVAGTSLENPEREPAFAWRFNRAWSPTISDVLQPATMNCN